jgi:hypothetical protein
MADSLAVVLVGFGAVRTHAHNTRQRSVGIPCPTSRTSTSRTSTLTLRRRRHSKTTINYARPTFRAFSNHRPTFPIVAQLPGVMVLNRSPLLPQKKKERKSFPLHGLQVNVIPDLLDAGGCKKKKISRKLDAWPIQFSSLLAQRLAVPPKKTLMAKKSCPCSDSNCVEFNRVKL